MGISDIKRKDFFHLFVLFLITISFSCSVSHSPADLDGKLENFFQKDAITIAVTDSGLGGLSIAAEAAERFSRAKVFESIDLLFFNALFSTEGGYNSLKTREEKILVFNSALRSLEENYHPDLIIIGCNTLSALYEDTAFSKKTTIPVVGIIDSGVALIEQSLKASPESKVIIFGTQTTIEEATYQKGLAARGIRPERVITQACPELESFIERGWASEETEMLISAYVDEALQKVKDHKESIQVSLNCTHYGYALESWKEAFASYGIKPLSFLNPNTKMIDFLFQIEKRNRFQGADMTVSVVSMVEISPERIASIGSWLEKVSLKTAEALGAYELKPDLFEWKKFVAGRD